MAPPPGAGWASPVPFAEVGHCDVPILDGVCIFLTGKLMKLPSVPSAEPLVLFSCSKMGVYFNMS